MRQIWHPQYKSLCHGTDIVKSYINNLTQSFHKQDVFMLFFLCFVMLKIKLTWRDISALVFWLWWLKKLFAKSPFRHVWDHSVLGYQKDFYCGHILWVVYLWKCMSEFIYKLNFSVNLTMVINWMNLLKSQ